MSQTFTSTQTFTYTDAKYLASKVAADLRQMHTFYGEPSLAMVDAFHEEFALLLRDGYLESVDYGFKKNDKVVFAISYKVLADGTVTTDDSSGRIVPGRDLAGTVWYSFLRYSGKYNGLTS